MSKLGARRQRHIYMCVWCIYAYVYVCIFVCVRIRMYVFLCIYECVYKCVYVRYNKIYFLGIKTDYYYEEENKITENYNWTYEDEQQ